MPDQPFLLGQQLSELTAPDHEVVRARVCRTESLPTSRSGEVGNDPEKCWKPVDRPSVIQRAATASPGARFGLACDAGLGKTFNMRWLFDQLCEKEYRPRIPFLLRLDDSRDLKLVMDACSNPDGLLDRFTDQVHLVSRHPKAPIRRELGRKRGHGQITLLFDGLDHALAACDFASHFAELLTSEHWKSCPVWVAGRPYAFSDAWKKVFQANPQWQFLQVERFGEREIRQYMTLCAGGDWFGTLPNGSRGLLGIPRLLRLICDIIRREIARAPAVTVTQVVLDGLKLNTPADVYAKAYFEKGRDGDPETQGLIAQGIKGEAEHIGLKDGQRPVYGNLSKRIDRVGALLGVTAFHLFDMNTHTQEPEPNTSGAIRDDIRERLIQRLEAAGQGGESDYDRDFDLLRHMNTHHVEFLLLAEASEERIRFPDRTVQAFFAAHWAMKYGTDADRANMQKWITAKLGWSLHGFSEFWEFAAEMPDQLIDPDKQPAQNRWHLAFAPWYAAPNTITGTHEWVQWHRRMIYSTFHAMRDRFPDTIISWRKPFTRLASPVEEKHSIWKAITAGFRDVPAGVCLFGAAPAMNKPSNPILVSAFQLHQYPVTNEMYELFEPTHQSNRWPIRRHPLAEEPGSDDRCPVVLVTWYDAWCFAAWCGCRLPTKREWEHACRAGTAFSFSFGNEDEELPDYAWFSENSGRSTHPVGERPLASNKHQYELFDLHGNVWEWCESWADREHEYRVLCGGSWGAHHWNCYVTNSIAAAPVVSGSHDFGFRLCRPGPG